MKRTIILLIMLLCARSGQSQDTPEVFTLLDGLYIITDQTPVLNASNVYPITLYQSYPTSLFNFRMKGQGQGLSVRVDPIEVPQLKIGEYTEFDVHVSVLPDARFSDDRTTVELSFDADELVSEQTYPLVIPLTQAAAYEIRGENAKTIGTVKVRVRWWAGWENWAYAVASIAIVAALIWQRRRRERPMHKGEA